jgi:6-phosphogluconate dehydrogenase
MKIAITGLGRMGGQIAQKLAEGGHEVVAHNRSPGPVDEAKKMGAIAAYDKQMVLDSFKNQQLVLWIMLPAEIIDSELDDWLKIIPKNSIIIDGGNSDFRKDKLRSKKVLSAGSTLLDIGTSGGVWGYKNGFCMMVGGSEKSFNTVSPALKSLSSPTGGFEYFGPAGSGHFVKMVHNAIEYGMMQSLAEGYRMLKEGPYSTIDLAKAGDVWQKRSVITSWLNELAAEAVSENPNMSGIEGVVSENGETRWTLEVASELGIPMPSIKASFDVRLASQKGSIDYSTKLLAAMRNKFGGHSLNPENK